MAAIRPVDVIAAKWATVTPQRSGDFEAGVQNPKANWQQNTLASADAWKSGVTAAMQAGSYAKGVSRAGNAGWQEGAIQKGVPRWGQGVALAQEKYQAGFAPYVDAIRRTTLPPRFARRDPRNLERVKAIVDALVKAKQAQS